MTTLRERLFRLAAWFEVSTRRIVVHLPRSFAWKPCWLRIAARLHAAPG
ncbi:MAG: transposase [Myxococcota bacterium]|nr:transposase [Myxococcota bacterium]